MSNPETFGVNLGGWTAARAQLAASFRAAAPIPHAVLDGAIDLPPSAVADFPAPDWPGWVSRDDVYQRQKVACRDLSQLPNPWQGLVLGFNLPAMLRLLEEATGISGLIGDPYLHGGGLTWTGGGGTLTPHTDHHVYPQLGLYRRLNLLVYLNPEWRPGDGGELVLWQKDHPDQRVVVEPLWGRAVVFQTDNQSVHGFLHPVREGCVRRSLALYYYTSAETETYAGDAWTRWFFAEAGGGVVFRARAAASQGLLHLAEGVAAVAHLLNPRRGAGWWRRRRERKNQP